MKRTFLILVAALFVLLACPSTHSEAALDSPVDTTPIVSSKPDSDGPVGVDDGDDDADDGDSDGLSGYRLKQGFTGGPSAGIDRTWVTVKLWWNLLFWYR